MVRQRIPDWAKDLPNSGPFSTVIQVGRRLHFSGVIARCNGLNKLASPGSIEEQVFEIFDKLHGWLELGDLTMKEVYGVTVMLKAANYQEFSNSARLFNDAYANVMMSEGVAIPPKGKMFGVTALPLDALVEIEFDVALNGEHGSQSTKQSETCWMAALNTAKNLREAITLAFEFLPLNVTGFIGPQGKLAICRIMMANDHVAVKVVDVCAKEEHIILTATLGPDQAFTDWISGSFADTLKEWEEKW